MNNNINNNNNNNESPIAKKYQETKYNKFLSESFNNWLEVNNNNNKSALVLKNESSAFMINKILEKINKLNPKDRNILGYNYYYYFYYYYNCYCFLVFD